MEAVVQLRLQLLAVLELGSVMLHRHAGLYSDHALGDHRFRRFATQRSLAEGELCGYLRVQALGHPLSDHGHHALAETLLPQFPEVQVQDWSQLKVRDWSQLKD